MQRSTAQPFAHLGSNFLKTLDSELESHALLLYLDDDGWLLCQVALSFCANPDVKKVVEFAKTIGATSLIRIQKQPFDHTDPFHTHSSATQTLYEAVKFYRLPLRELVLIAEDSEKIVKNKPQF